MGFYNVLEVSLGVFSFVNSFLEPGECVDNLIKSREF